MSDPHNISNGRPVDSGANPADGKHRDHASADYQQQMQHDVASKEHRKIAARQNQRNVWYGLGMFGLVGWSIAVPTVVGTFAGIWMDRHFHMSASWTLMGLFGGLGLGCWIAWYWIHREGLTDEFVESPENTHNDSEEETE